MTKFLDDSTRVSLDWHHMTAPSLAKSLRIRHMMILAGFPEAWRWASQDGVRLCCGYSIEAVFAHRMCMATDERLRDDIEGNRI